MNPKTTLLIFLLVALSLGGVSCEKTGKAKVASRNRLDESGFPRRIVWAWERREDLEFLDAGEFGVAFLAQTLVLKGADVVSKPRRNSLKVSPGTRLIAVT